MVCAVWKDFALVRAKDEQATAGQGAEGQVTGVGLGRAHGHALLKCSGALLRAGLYGYGTCRVVYSLLL